ncbi:M16 family metallopeptidase [Flavihumibacter petaseus]|uniref:Peptidase M16 family protein n=1 Tax=Flavihumibacter petaseus NBRC 106054 TaxID=1220578 RepID=A0A0E9MWT4_9BACT|nr:pitrilysin family protein [Flavihumibacter petaseus]GAO42212.1 peptidase M16 family protein [Flavihumibacter petaseus NBRC 106054]
MIQFARFVLPNGLRVLVHEDASTPMAVVNVLYDVGARDEDPSRTGFAHLFEHLMFGGSINIPEYDDELQKAGGENNAYTTNDLTNYYCQLPSANIETAFWLESDRMLSLAFSKKSLDVQRKVVSEEFKEHYLNKPYGDVWFKMREMAYERHPYRWMTIGRELRHIEEASLQDVKAFFSKHYTPVNAILVVAGNVVTEQVYELAEKWFGDIPSGIRYQRHITQEPEQHEAKRMDIEAEVPVDAFLKTWHMPSRMDPRYYAVDLLTDILGSGASSRLYQTLVKEQQLFTNIDCYHFGSSDAGLICIDGKLVRGVTLERAEAAVEAVLARLKAEGLTNAELEKVKNKTESTLAFEDMSVMNRAASLAYYELLGDAQLMNTELEKYQAVTAEDIQEESRIILREGNSHTLYYRAKSPALAEADISITEEDEEEND